MINWKLELEVLREQKNLMIIPDKYKNNSYETLLKLSLNYGKKIRQNKQLIKEHKKFLSLKQDDQSLILNELSFINRKIDKIIESHERLKGEVESE